MIFNRKEMTVMEPRVVEKKHSQRYAEAVHYAESLESEISHYRDVCAKLQSDVNLCNGRIRQLEEELERSRVKAEDLSARNTTIHAQLAVASKVILDIYDAERKVAPAIAIEDIVTDVKEKKNVHRNLPVASDAADRTEQF